MTVVGDGQMKRPKQGMNVADVMMGDMAEMI